MADGRPLLTIAIPTYNRSRMLGELLEALLPQLREHPDVELLVSDNASPDETAETVGRAQQALGRPIRYCRQAENIGSDANFIFCFEQAHGRYVWICGDDDVLVPAEGGQPGALDQLMPHLRAGEFDLVYATSFGFRENWRRERAGDPLGRRFHVIRSPRQFVRVTNIMFTFISGIVVNKERFLELAGAPERGIVPPREFLGSNLPQLAWTLPLLRWHRQSLVLWERPVGGRQGNAAGYALGHVFGEQLVAALRRTLPDRPELRRILGNFMLRRWLPSIVRDLRGGDAAAAGLLASSGGLRASYGRNPRFWIFTWPVLRLPLAAAGVWAKAGAALSKLIYMAELPMFWRREIGAGTKPTGAENRTLAARGES